jgi:hypothetical protein
MGKQSAEVLAQITAPHFCAGLIQRDGTVRQAAPIVKYMIGWSIQRAVEYARSKGWRVDPISVSVFPEA